jgi:2-hydroxychromene-2-carboxylate isomerase
VNRKLRSAYLKLLVSSRYRTFCRLKSEIGRRLAFKKHVVHVFLQIDDPYSYLLSQYLAHFAEQYKVELRVYLTQAIRSDYMPEPALLAEYAYRDCELLARELGIPFLDKGSTPAVEHRRALLDFLAEEQGQLDFVETMQQALSHYWRGDAEGAARLMGRIDAEPSETNVLVAKNQLLLRKMGHYSSAMMFYAGEWYWGIDRLGYLCERLDGLRARREKDQVPERAALAHAMQLSLPAAVPASAKELPALEMYHSFRSPYSYLALSRAIQIADAFGVQLVIRPVLPMVMRGLKVPTPKLLYIAKDANREAERLNIPFGDISDPVGKGAERCIAAFCYAREQGKERDFVLSAGRAIWSEGQDVATDEGMRHVTERAGLFWPDVLDALKNDDWRQMAEENREALTELGLWGVPSFHIDDVTMWGQDRDWLMARQIEDMCHGGDGIMV